jgi:hypothetical protein
VYPVAGGAMIIIPNLSTASKSSTRCREIKQMAKKKQWMDALPDDGDGVAAVVVDMMQGYCMFILSQ